MVAHQQQIASRPRQIFQCLPIRHEFVFEQILGVFVLVQPIPLRQLGLLEEYSKNPSHDPEDYLVLSLLVELFQHLPVGLVDLVLCADAPANEIDLLDKLVNNLIIWG